MVVVCGIKVRFIWEMGNEKRDARNEIRVFEKIRLAGNAVR
jgi:hypothetical protein